MNKEIESIYSIDFYSNSNNPIQNENEKITVKEFKMKMNTLDKNKEEFIIKGKLQFNDDFYYNSCNNIKCKKKVTSDQQQWYCYQCNTV